MKFAQLNGKKVAIWGLGREGKAALIALRHHLPEQPLTVFASQAEARKMAAISGIDWSAASPDATMLSAFDYVIKSPGISSYKPEIQAAQRQGTVFTSGTALWFGENPHQQVIGVTGTKGKSTTSALLAYLARAAGWRVALAGNIGLPLLALDDQHADCWIVELSSFQTGEADLIDTGIVTSLYEEHLDWHGSYERYVSDKLKLAGNASVLWVSDEQDELKQRTHAHPDRHFFGGNSRWHVEPGDGTGKGAAIYRDDQAMLALSSLPLAGYHNALNACAALAVLEQKGLDLSVMLKALPAFTPLPHRLQNVGKSKGLYWINDSISTTPQAALAALESLPDEQPVTLLLGGYDRGLDWTGVAGKMATFSQLTVVTQGGNGPRICQVLHLAGKNKAVHAVDTLAQALTVASEVSAPGSYIVLSPGAPSFDQFASYTERGRFFMQYAGLEKNATTQIDGLGIA